MKIWFDVVEFNCNLLGGGEEDSIGTFNDVQEAINFERDERRKRGNVYKSFQTVVCYEYEDACEQGAVVDLKDGGEKS